MAHHPTYTIDGSQIWYMDAFTVAASAMSLQVSGGTVQSIAAGEYVMDDQIVAGYTGVGTYQLLDFCAALVTTLNASLPDASWAVTYTGFNLTISRNTAFSITWSPAHVLQQQLGFTGNLVNNTTFTANRPPQHLMVPAVNARTQFSDLQEDEGAVTEAVADDGTPYAVARSSATFNVDWQQSMESIAQVYARRAAASDDPALQTNIPWTWEKFWMNVRGKRPFFVYDGTSRGPAYTIHKLRASDGSFRPKRVAPDDDTYWNVQFQTRDLGIMKVS